MGTVIDVAAVMRLLGDGGEHPVAARRHRGILATRHSFDRGAHWTWSAQRKGTSAIAGLTFADVPMRVRSGDSDEIVDVGQASFLHPHRRVEVDSTASGTGTCVWLPWDALSEVESGVQTPGLVLSSTPLTAGLQAFLDSLLTQSEPPTLYTDYLVERIVAEMAFGVLLESVPKLVSGTTESRHVDRARSLMLMRRAEPGFGVAELAQELHMSTRQVQRIFAAEDSAPADELRGMRIELANELLGDPAYDALSLADIAMHAGFTSTAALRRAFAARGLTPPKRSGLERIRVS